MNLKAFHILLISLASRLGFVFGGWSLHQWSSGGGAASLLTGVFSLAAAVAAIFYVIWFRRKITTPEEEERRRRKLIRRVPAVIAAWMIGQRAAHACTVCYGEADGPMIDAARLGVFLLFGLVLAMQIAFALFFVNLWRRSRRMRQDEA